MDIGCLVYRPKYFGVGRSAASGPRPNEIDLTPALESLDCLFAGWLLMSQQHTSVYLRDWSAQTSLFAATL